MTDALFCIVPRWWASWTFALPDELALATRGVAQRLTAHRPTTTAFRTYLRVGDRCTARAAVGLLRRVPGAAVRV
jgi:hypothetical protein